MIRSLKYRVKSSSINAAAFVFVIVIITVVVTKQLSSKGYIRLAMDHEVPVLVKPEKKLVVETVSKIESLKAKDSGKSQIVNKDSQQQDQQHADGAANERKFSGYRIIHLDLKGAPPKMAYYKKLFPFLRSIGATGVLIEYEDMFPYKDTLKVLARQDAYTENEVNAIVQLAEEFQLMVIPLIQTFGHLKFMLKHDNFKNLSAGGKDRALCPCQNSSLPILLEMIKQNLALHPKVNHLHVGGDEIYELMDCVKCKSLRFSRPEMYLLHMVPLLSKIKQWRADLTLLMWDDMLRKWSVEQLLILQNLATPMVWAYEDNLKGYFPKTMWPNYKQVFNKVWLASSFKGAKMRNTDVVPMNKHIENHLQWLKIMNEVEVDIIGIAITGWSRFDHVSPLCELLPAGLPSLAMCLTALDRGNMNQDVIQTVSVDALGCAGRIYDDSSASYQLQKCGFPGSDVFLIVNRLDLLRKEVGAFLGQVRLMAKKGQVTDHHKKAADLLSRINQLKGDTENTFEEVYGKSVIVAWITEKIEPVSAKAQEIMRITKA